ncbi:putative nuclease HARBI1 [Centruroides vittatus]|uniref:putative nuclease HARBI1 n=1 Tax=Centruroides vittatus TaxID=120091 RepID=UPI0035104391
MAVSKSEVLNIVSAIVSEVFFSDESEDEIGSYVILETSKKRKRRLRIKGYVESVVPSYLSDDFQCHFRMKRCTFEIVLEKLKPKLLNSFGRPCLDANKQILSVIWLLANQESFRSVADRFDISKSTLYSYLNKVCNELIKMASDVIKWPKLEEYAHLTRKFKNIAGFPGIIGAIDGCHIPIKAPSEAAEKYINRKNFHSLILQAVCNHNLVFTDCYLSPTQMHTYNNKLSKSRIVIERSFALLKGRFRRLKYFDANKTSMLPLYILSACVLHNICLMAGDDFDEFDTINCDDEMLENESSNTHYNSAAQRKRQLISDSFLSFQKSCFV